MGILRPYQLQCLDSLREAREASPVANRLAVEMATGLGKTITFAAELDEWLAADGSGRALVLVHTDELVRQAVDKIRFVTRGRWSVGVVKADRDETGADIVVASVQTLARPGRRERIQDVGKIIVDECHHAVAKTYIDILEHYRGIWTGDCADPECYGGCLAEDTIPVTGYTATLARTDGRGLGQVWQDLAFSRSLPWAIRKGHLIDLVPYTIRIPDLDVTGTAATLDTALVESIAPEAVVNAWLEKVGYPGNVDASTVLFAPLVASAKAFADAFNGAGVKAEVVHGDMATPERTAVLERYEAGVTTVVCNAMVLTEGWDSPRTGCVVVARPTQSVPLFVQMVGRGLRPWLDAAAPARADQRCILLCVQDTATQLATVADLSDRIGDVRDGSSLLAMEDEWDLGKDIEQDEDTAYRGPVRVEQWDALVQQSSRAWKYTVEGAPYLPTAKRSAGYVFIVPVGDTWIVWVRQRTTSSGHRVLKLATAPDLELAMSLAEDEAQERGGDIGALLADKGRAWRRAVPSHEMQEMARRVGIPAVEINRIMSQRAAGKAGKLSDLIDRVVASKALDHNVRKIRERGQPPCPE